LVGVAGEGAPSRTHPLATESAAYLGGVLEVTFPNERGWALLGFAPGGPQLPGVILQGPVFCSQLRLYPDLTQANWVAVTANPGSASFAIPRLAGLQDASVCLQAVVVTAAGCLTATNGLAVILR
jgi:hypothetical protein